MPVFDTSLGLNSDKMNSKKDFRFFIRDLKKKISMKIEKMNIFYLTFDVSLNKK